MKKFLFASLLACSAGDAEWHTTENIGTLEQPIYMPSNYGFDGNFNRCGATWGGGVCYVPDNTDSNVTLNIYVDDASCTGFSGFMKDRIHAVVNLFETDVEALGMQVTQVNSIFRGNKYTVKCGSVTGKTGEAALTVCDTHATSKGSLKQHCRGTVKINENLIYTYSGFVNGTLAQQVTFSENAVRHELYHIAGLGHETPDDANDYLMQATFQTSNSLAWNANRQPSSSEKSAIDCYNATSGTGDRCAD